MDPFHSIPIPSKRITTFSKFFGRIGWEPKSVIFCDDYIISRTSIFQLNHTFQMKFVIIGLISFNKFIVANRQTENWY